MIGKRGKRPHDKEDNNIPAKRRQKSEEEVKEVKAGTGTEEHKRKRTLFLRNLSESVEEEDIMEVFAKIVPDVKIVDVRVIRDENGVKRGIAFVDVET